jgi:hypothetical protein
MDVSRVTTWNDKLPLRPSDPNASRSLRGDLQFNIKIIILLILIDGMISRCLPQLHTAVIRDSDHLSIGYLDNLVDTWLMLLNAIGLLNVKQFIIFYRKVGVYVVVMVLEECNTVLFVKAN